MSARKRRVEEQTQRIEEGFTFPSRRKRDAETPETSDCSYPIEEGINPAFDQNRALLRRVFFLDDNKTRYVSVAFYPAMGYQPMVEFGGSKIAPIRLPQNLLAVLVEHLPRFCEASCNNEHHTSGIHDGFWIITTTYRAIWMYLGLNRRKYITYKLSDLLYLNSIMHIVLDQLARYNGAMSDVMSYAMTAMYSTEYVEPLPTYNKNVLYPQLYEELKKITLL
jgi:hypothetical protein